ncbi:MAG: Hsp70 family protein [Planctomycetes bacterium]|nr:Hsp70 family protein [Planctomycetota bacterium]
MREYFGIDFGTTNSAVVGNLGRHSTRYGVDDEQPFPSLVAVNCTTGTVDYVGRDVFDKRLQLAESCRIFSSAKMDLGEGKSWMVGPETWTPERVVAEVLKGLKKRVKERSHGASLEEAVIAIPVGFPPKKRNALRAAALEAGINIRGFVSEPTAAVFQSLEDLKQWPNVVVFDWGGGTLDISVVKIHGNVVQEIATVPKTLGGDDLDRILAEWAHAQILSQKGGSKLPFSGMDSRDQDMLLAACEEAKRKLANHDKAAISLQRYGEFGSVDLNLTDEEFISLMQPKIDEALATLEEGVIYRARLSFDQVHILMVGGSSKLKGLQDAMTKQKWQFSLSKNSDWHVAEGAARLASSTGKYVSAQNVGVRLCDDTVYPIIRAGQTVDHGKQSATFGLIEDASNARFVFVESDDPDGRLTSMNRTIGHLVVPAFGFTNEPIHLESHVDEDLLLHVTARSQAKGEKPAPVWTYPELRFSYALPETT